MTPDNSAEARARATFDKNAAAGEAMMVTPQGVVARETLKQFGIETLNGGSIAWRGNTMPGHNIVAAMLTFSAEQNSGGLPGREAGITEYHRGWADGHRSAVEDYERKSSPPKQEPRYTDEQITRWYNQGSDDGGIPCD